MPFQVQALLRTNSRAISATSFARSGSIALLWVCIFVFFIVVRSSGNAAELKKARVSQVIQDVRLLGSNAASRPAAVNDSIGEGTAVRTGTASRAELTFADLTITRLGENTVFSFSAGTRELNLSSGAVLVEVPPKGAAVKIKTPAVTASITGGTALFSKGPPAKFMVLEGTGTFYPTGHPEEAVTLHGGEMVMMTADGHITQPTKFNVQLVLSTSHLIVDFPELTNLPLILNVLNQQLADQLAATASSSPPPSKDIIDVISQNTTANPAVVTFTATPAPTGTPSEFGPPPTISTPDPYVINSGTSIVTDPSITTNGVTNLGTFYRGTALDGTPSQFLFGQAPTSFDQMVFSGAQNNLPIAVFKFADLELAGDPTITVPSGGATNLALVSVGAITSGAPGGTLTFAGIQRLDFITQNGSINLGSDISFSGIDHLTFYARGSGSNLTLASPISGGSVVHLYSEGSIQVNGSISVSDTFTALTGGDFLAGSGPITATNIDIESLNDININASQFPNPADNTGSVTLNALNTLNLNLDRGGGFGWSSLDASAETINIFGANGFDFSNASGDVIFAACDGGINASGIEFFGHNLTLTSTGDITIGSAITPTVGGEGPHILDGSISAGGAFASSGSVYTGSMSAGTTITIGGSLTVGGNVTAGGDITAAGDITATSSSGNISITVGGALTSTGGGVAASVDNSGGSIGGSASVNVNVPGAINTQSDATFQIDNSEGGQIAQGAQISLSAGSLAVGGSLTAFINNRDGGSIGSSAQVLVDVAGALSTQGDATIGISNRNDGAGGGTVGGDATVSVQANSISVGGFLTSFVAANGGQINGQASLTFNVAGDIQSGTGTEFDLQSDAFNSSGGPLTPGLIASDAVLSITAANLTSGGFIESDIFNNGGGHIQGNATLTVNLSGDINGQQGILATIEDTGFSPNGGVGSPSQIDGNAVVTLQAQNIITSSIATGTIGIDTMALEASIYTNVNGIVGGDAIVNVTASQDISAGGTALFWVANGNYQGLGPGTIGGNAEVNVSATDISTGDFFFQIENYGGSQIGENASLSLTANSMTVNGSLNVILDNFSGGKIGGDATAQLSIGPVGDAASLAPASAISGDLTADSVALQINNTNGGQIGGVAIASLNLTGDLITTSSATIQILNTTGSIGGSASTNLNIAGNATVSGVLQMLIENYDFSGNNPGQIGGSANISITTGGDLSAGSVFGIINNRSGGSIDGSASLTINVSGALTTTTDNTDPLGFPESLSLYIESRFDSTNGNPAGASSINGDATLDVSADSASIGGRLQAVVSNRGSTINGNALLEFGITNNMTVQNEADFQILNGADTTILNGGTIHGSATLQVSANDFTANALFAYISNQRGGVIDGNAMLAFNLTGNFSIPGTNPGDSTVDSTVPGEADLLIENQQGTGTAGGMIDGNASITLSAASISTAGLLDPTIINNHGTITGDATIGITNTGDVTADSLDVEINNGGGSIGGNAIINMNVGGTATITNDATFAITGNDPTGAAAINFNGGNYSVGGTFLSTIDGNGTIKFANASVQADTVKAAVFGSNGTLMIGGGSLSANTLMKLYATGSNGTIDFTANVTLTCKAAALILAANTITINDNVVVTIAGSFQASVYANIANYSGSGGNGTTTGTFAGAGASNPQSLGNAPPFSASATSATKSSASGSTTVASATASSSTKSQSSSSTTVASSSNVNAVSGGARQSPSQSDVSLAAARKATSGKATTSSTINVSNSAELLSLLDAATPGPGGKITVPASKSTSNSRNSSNAGSRVKSDRMDIQGSIKKPTLLSSAPSFHRAAF
jgi:FecR protein